MQPEKLKTNFINPELLGCIFICANTNSDCAAKETKSESG